MRKRILYVLVGMALCAGLVPAVALAAPHGGDMAAQGVAVQSASGM